MIFSKHLGILLLIIMSLELKTSAAEIDFSASLDRAQIAVDESVSLKMSVSSTGNSAISGMKYLAPDFEMLNEYSSNVMQSFYENGQFGMRKTQSITKVLRPLRQGELKITGIQIQIDGQIKKAPDLQVTVNSGGAGTPPPSRYGGSGVGLRGSGKTGNRSPFFVRAELNHAKVYKGQQLIISYFLYRRVKIFNIVHDKIPVLNGFLREDLDTPLFTGNRLDSEMVVLDGVQYLRSLLARYAAYPLKEGRLPVDSMGLKFSYIPDRDGQGDFDEDDVMGVFGAMGFMSPRVAQEKSVQVPVEVLPLPVDGRPASFTGGVGDFELAHEVDRKEVKVNEALTLSVKVSGKGNLSAIGEPALKVPSGLELYDHRSRAGTASGGVSEKIFEYVLIPRVGGAYEIPAIEFSAFNPTASKYYSKATTPFQILATGESSATGSVSESQPSRPGKSDSLSPFKPRQEYFGLKSEHDARESESLEIHGQPFWRWLYRAFVLFLLSFLLMVAFASIRRLKRMGLLRAAQRTNKSVKELSQKVQKLKKNSQTDSKKFDEDLTRAYEFVSGLIYDSLDQKFGITSRALTRKDLETLVVGAEKLSMERWVKLSELLEFAEKVRFALGSGAVSKSDAIRRLEESVTLLG